MIIWGGNDHLITDDYLKKLKLSLTVDWQVDYFYVRVYYSKDRQFVLNPVNEYGYTLVGYKQRNMSNSWGTVAGNPVTCTVDLSSSGLGSYLQNGETYYVYTRYRDGSGGTKSNYDLAYTGTSSLSQFSFNVRTSPDQRYSYNNYQAVEMDFVGFYEDILPKVYFNNNGVTKKATKVYVNINNKTTKLFE